MTRVQRRVARKPHICEGCRGGRIKPGEVYLEWVVSPHDSDLGNERWWRLYECADCALRYGRGEMVA